MTYYYIINPTIGVKEEKVDEAKKSLGLSLENRLVSIIIEEEQFNKLKSIAEESNHFKLNRNDNYFSGSPHYFVTDIRDEERILEIYQQIETSN